MGVLFFASYTIKCSKPCRLICLATSLCRILVAAILQEALIVVTKCSATCTIMVMSGAIPSVRLFCRTSPLLQCLSNLPRILCGYVLLSCGLLLPSAHSAPLRNIMHGLELWEAHGPYPLLKWRTADSIVQNWPISATYAHWRAAQQVEMTCRFPRRKVAPASDVEGGMCPTYLAVTNLLPAGKR